MTIFICTVGASIAENSRVDTAKLEKMDFEAVGSTEYKIAWEDKVKKAINTSKGDKKRQSDLSAELKSLLAYGLNVNDEIYLLHSDDLLGHLCGDALKEALQLFTSITGANIKTCRVEGLRMTSFADFTNRGIGNLYREAISIIDKASGEYNPDLVINITGGYKVVVPYMTLLGMLFRLKIIYIFKEEGSGLIILPPLPLTYDEELLLRAEKFLKKLSSEREVPKTEYPKELEVDRTKYIPSVIEEDGNKLKLTSLGQLLYERFVQDYPEDLPKCTEEGQGKKIHLSSTHHGNDVLKEFANRLIKSPYVCEILDSIAYSSFETNFILSNQSFENGEVKIVLYKVDRGIGLKLRTSGRTPLETKRIAELLERKYWR